MSYEPADFSNANAYATQKTKEWLLSESAKSREYSKSLPSRWEAANKDNDGYRRMIADPEYIKVINQAEAAKAEYRETIAHIDTEGKVFWELTPEENAIVEAASAKLTFIITQCVWRDLYKFREKYGVKDFSVSEDSAEEEPEPAKQESSRNDFIEPVSAIVAILHQTVRNGKRRPAVKDILAAARISKAKFYRLLGDEPMLSDAWGAAKNPPQADKPKGAFHKDDDSDDEDPTIDPYYLPHGEKYAPVKVQKGRLK